MLSTRPSSAPSPSTQPAPFDLHLVQDYHRFHQVLNHGSKPVLILDEDGTLRHTNPLAQRAFHRFAPQLLGNSFFSMVHRNDLKSLMRHLNRLAKAETDAPCDGSPLAPLLLRLFTRRDRWRWFEASLLRFSYRAENEKHVLAVKLHPLPSA